MRRALAATVFAALACASAASAKDEPELLASHGVLLAAATVPSHDPNDLRFVGIPGETIDGAMSGAFPLRPEDFETTLPPPPQKVTLDNSYAPVTFSHAGHLSRRTACKKCHGEGPVRKIGRFQPKVAHDTCRKCHVEVAKGPTDCRGCHLVKPKVEPTELAKAEPPDPRKRSDLAGHSGGPAAMPVSVAMLTPGVGLPYSDGAATASFETASAWPSPRGTAATPEPLTAAPEPMARQPRRSVFAGASMIAGQGAPTAAAAMVQVTMKQDGWQVTESVEWGSGSGARRALGLLGGGVVRPIRPEWSWHALGVGGFDALNMGWTAFLPAVGARAGVEWASPRPFLHSVDLSVTWLTDVTRAHDPRGNTMGGGVLSISLSAGLDLRAARR